MSSTQPRGGGIVWSLFFTRSRNRDNGETIYICNACHQRVSDHPKNGFHHVYCCSSLTSDEIDAGLAKIPPEITAKYQLKKEPKKRKLNEVMAGDMHHNIDDHKLLNSSAGVSNIPLTAYRSELVTDLFYYSDLPAALGLKHSLDSHAARQQTHIPPALSSDDVLASFGKLPAFPSSVEVMRVSEYVVDGILIEELQWWVGYGPATRAFLLQAENTRGMKKPGVLYLHSHDDVKQFGKEKVVDGRTPLPRELQWVKDKHYGGQAPCNELARRGFVVLVHDCFMWGSRGFPLEAMPARLRELVGVSNYETLAVMHESMVLSKYLSLCGSTLAGMVNFDDRVALQVLNRLPETLSGGVGVVGLSGGGCRALLLHAVTPCHPLAQHNLIKATVSVGAMATYGSMLDRHIAPHSWMFFPHNLAGRCDWPDIAIIGHPKPLFVQYCADDALFTLGGMQMADQIIAAGYGRYTMNGRRSNLSEIELYPDESTEQNDPSAVLGEFPHESSADAVLLSDHDYCDHNDSPFSPELQSIALAAVEASSSGIGPQDSAQDASIPMAAELAACSVDNLMGSGRGLSMGYKGSFYPVGHSFTVPMQKDAFDWLARAVQ